MNTDENTNWRLRAEDMHSLVVAWQHDAEKLYECAALAKVAGMSWVGMEIRAKIFEIHAMELEQAWHKVEGQQ